MIPVNFEYFDPQDGRRGCVAFSARRGIKFEAIEPSLIGSMKAYGLSDSNIKVIASKAEEIWSAA